MSFLSSFRRLAPAIAKRHFMAIILTFVCVLGAPWVMVAWAVDPPITGTVTTLADGTGIEGAIVTIAGPDQVPISDTTDVDGNYSLEPTGVEAYSISVQATGFGSQADEVDTSTEDFQLAPGVFTPLPVYAGSINRIAADATSGVFYGLAEGEEVYRTSDYGGTWQIMTPAYDDPANGVVGGGVEIATSGVPGEVAVAAGRNSSPSSVTSYSTDFGLTWQSVGGEDLPSGVSASQPLQFSWAHAGDGAPSVLIAARKQDDLVGWDVWRADMSVESPVFEQIASDPIGDGAVYDITNSDTGSFIGRVNSSSELSFAPLTGSGDITFGEAVVTDLPANPSMVRFGGEPELDAPPSGLLVVGGINGGPYTAQMITKGEGIASFGDVSASVSTATAISNDGPEGCGFGTDADGFGNFHFGSVSPLSLGTDGSGNIASCWVAKTGTNALVITRLQNIAQSELIYDANWGNSNDVVLAGSGGSGAVKAASEDIDGVPEFPDVSDPAAAGTAADSGGLSEYGIVTPSVSDIDTGPTTGDVSLSLDFGRQRLASKDGGETLTLIGRGASYATQWWQGATAEWLVWGDGDASAELVAKADWDGVSGDDGNIQVDNSAPEQLGGPVGGLGYATYSMVGVDGTDSLFFGMGQFGGATEQNGNHLWRGSLVVNEGAAPSLGGDLIDITMPEGITLYQPQAMAYCPAGAANASLQDVLLVATGDLNGVEDEGSTKGQLLRIADAMTETPTVTQITSGIPFDEGGKALTVVRASCDTGVVYVGGRTTDPGASALYRSTDGGVTFATRTVPAPNGQAAANIRSIDFTADDPNVITVSAEPGLINSSTDGGVTWTVVYDSEGSRPMDVDDVELPDTPAEEGGGGLGVFLGSLPRILVDDPAVVATVGSDAGAFAGDISSPEGVIGVRNYATGKWLNQQLTPMTTDTQPVLVAHSTGMAAVMKRSNGLYFTLQTDGSWSLPAHIEGTSASDSDPQLKRDSYGRLLVAFRRSSGTPGIYLATRNSNGMWAALRRISTSANDSQPSITSYGSRVHVAWVRSASGIYHATGLNGTWKSVKVYGTGSADGMSSLGGPSVGTSSSGKVYLAFTRGSGNRGIYLSTRSTTWRAPVRLTPASTDRNPVLRVDSLGAITVAYRHNSSTAGGFYWRKRGASTNASWTTAKRISYTLASDSEPTLASKGTTVSLAFTRTSGASQGIYLLDRIGSTSAPVRRSTSTDDGTPTAAFSSGGEIQLLFGRYGRH